ncbi:MAG: sodium-translocating pyrophosphatase [Planctomycetes bacterium]|nr:sodium-translocating pyrophosphatase [Planctomycetota bacterium]
MKGLLRSRALPAAALVFIVGFLFAVPAFAQEDRAPLSFEGPNRWVAIAWLVAPLGAVVALAFAYFFHQQMKKANPGSDRMQKIAAAVRRGALAYLLQQYKIVFIVFIVLVVVLFVMSRFGMQHWLVPFAFLSGGIFSGICGFLGMNTATQASSRTAQAASESLNQGLQVAFRSGAVMGFVVVGFGLLDIAAWFYICNNVLQLPLGEVTVTMLAFGMGASTQALFARVGGGIYTKAADVGSDLVGKVEAGIPEDDPRNPATIADNVGDNVGDVAGMGADLYESYCGSILSTAALGFATAQSLKPGVVAAADSLPWVVFPMVIAGVGIILSALATFAVRTGEDTSLKNLMAALFRGINLATVLTAIGALFIGIVLLNGSDLIDPGMNQYLRDADGNPLFSMFLGVNTYIWRVWLAVVVGLVAGVIVAKAAEYYTSNDYKPTQGIAENALTGPATVIIDGVAVGMMSTGIPVITVAIGIFLSFWLSGGFVDPIRGLYGISIAAVGMLATLGITLATDAYGPIADNAGGNAQMSGLPPHVRERTDALDALGNTTAATGKGFAIASAALTAMALLAAYVEEIRIGLERISHKAREAPVMERVRFEDARGDYDLAKVQFRDAGHGILYARAPEGAVVRHIKTKEGWIEQPVKVDGAYLTLTEQTHGSQTVVKVVPVREASLGDFMAFYKVTLMNPNVLIGLFIGAMMTFVFCAMTMKAVGRAARSMVLEVRRQFREIAGIMEGKAEPDYARCVAISTVGAQREMVVPALIAIIVPIITGALFNVAGVMGLLAGGLSTGFAMAIMMAAAGGAWDNAKKWIEAGHLKDEKGIAQGKGSVSHKAAVVGDTVGDPFKDTSGPSLNILIKLMSMVSIVFVGVTLALGPVLASLLR